MGVTGKRPSLTSADGKARAEAASFAPVDSVAAPADLPAGVRRVWTELARPMADAGLLDQVDAVALEAIARCVDRWRQAEALLDEEGMFVSSPNGYKVAHPAVAVSQKAQAEYRAWAARFGLTPIDRVSMGLAALRGKSLEQDISAKIGPSPRNV